MARRYQRTTLLVATRLHMLSRVADSLYWMSRYIERAENDARILDVNLQLLLDLGGPRPRPCNTGHR